MSTGERSTSDLGKENNIVILHHRGFDQKQLGESVNHGPKFDIQDLSDNIKIHHIHKKNDRLITIKADSAG